MNSDVSDALTVTLTAAVAAAAVLARVAADPVPSGVAGVDPPMLQDVLDVGLLPALLAVAVGALLGAALRRLVTRGSHRRADEADLPPPATWWMPAALGAAFGFASRSTVPAAAVVAAAATLLVVVAAIDLDVRRIPNALSLPAYPLAVAALLAAEVARGWGGSAGADVLRALAAGVVSTLAYLAAHALPVLLGRRTGLGLGDVKLAGVLGMLLGRAGWAEALVGVYAGFVVAGAIAVALLVTRHVTRDTALPHAPPMIAGAALALLAGDAGLL